MSEQEPEQTGMPFTEAVDTDPVGVDEPTLPVTGDDEPTETSQPEAESE